MSAHPDMLYLYIYIYIYIYICILYDFFHAKWVVEEAKYNCMFISLYDTRK